MASVAPSTRNCAAECLRRRHRRGVFRSVADIQTAINRYPEKHNVDPKPVVWTKCADTLLTKLNTTAPSVRYAAPASRRILD